MDTQRLQGTLEVAAKVAVARPAAKAVPTRESRQNVSRPDVAADEDRADKKSTKVDGERVAKALQQHFDDRQVSFAVRDVNKTGANNVIIEIREGDKVIATIPSKEVMEMSERLKESGGLGEVSGALLDRHG